MTKIQKHSCILKECLMPSVLCFGNTETIIVVDLHRWISFKLLTHLFLSPIMWETINDYIMAVLIVTRCTLGLQLRINYQLISWLFSRFIDKCQKEIKMPIPVSWSPRWHCLFLFDQQAKTQRDFVYNYIKQRKLANPLEKLQPPNYLAFLFEKQCILLSKSSNGCSHSLWLCDDWCDAAITQPEGGHRG